MHLLHLSWGTFKGKAEVLGYQVACPSGSLDKRRPKVSAEAPRLLVGRRPKLIQLQENLCCCDTTQREAVGVDAPGALDR